MMTPNEQLLVDRCRAGDEAAWLALYRTYAGDVGAFLRGMLRYSDAIDDLVQRVFLEFLSSLPRFLIGIDLYYRDSAGSYEGLLDDEDTRTIDGDVYQYVRMQDVPLFSDAHPFEAGLRDGSVAYTFALGASAADPMTPTFGCFMTVVVDSSGVEAG